MINNDIIHKYLDLHPDTPIDGREYAISLRMVSYMLETAVKLEREACAKFIEDEYVRDFDKQWRIDLTEAIRSRGQE